MHKLMLHALKDMQRKGQKLNWRFFSEFFFGELIQSYVLSLTYKKPTAYPFQKDSITFFFIVLRSQILADPLSIINIKDVHGLN